MNDLFLNNFWTSEKIREFRRKDAKVHEQESIVFGFLHSWAEKFCSAISRCQIPKNAKGSPNNLDVYVYIYIYIYIEREIFI